MKPSIGRIVHFVLNHGDCRGEHRPAIITRVVPVVNLHVFSDAHGSGRTASKVDEPCEWGDAKQDEATKLPGTWHWPERED